MTSAPNVAVVAIAGGSGAGKTTLARLLCGELGAARCTMVGQDSYYIDQSRRFVDDGGSVNFDDPTALDFQLLAEHLARLRSGQAVEIPTYDFATHSRLARGIVTQPAQIVLLDGTLVLSQPQLTCVIDVGIFIDTDAELRMTRRLRRDTVERGRTPAGVLRQWQTQVQPMYERFVAPSRSNADYIINDDASRSHCLAELAATLGRP